MQHNIQIKEYAIDLIMTFKDLFLYGSVLLSIILIIFISTGTVTAAPNQPVLEPTIAGEQLNQSKNPFMSTGTGDDNTLTGINTANTESLPTKILNKNYIFRSHTQIYDIIPTDDGNYLLVGSVVNYPDSYINDIENGTAIKIAPNGSVIWERTYGNRGGDQAIIGGIQSDSGGFVLAGRTFPDNSVYYVQTGWGIKINKTGTKIWDVKRGGYQQGYFNAVEETADGNYLFVGSYADVAYGVRRGEVVKTDSSGKIMSQSVLSVGPQLSDESFFDIERIKQDEYILAGQTTINGDYDALSMKIDSDANKISNHTYGNESLDDWFSYLSLSGDNDVTFAGVTNGVWNDSTEAYDSADAWVYHSNDTSSDWSDTVSGSNATAFGSISADEDRIVAAGVSYPEGGNAGDGVAVEYSMNGKQNWRLTDTKQYHVYQDVLASGNETYLVGEEVNITSGNSSGKLIKYSSATSDMSEVKLRSVDISPGEVNSSNETHTLTFEVVNISPDNKKDNFTISLPTDIDVNNVTIKNADGLDPVPVHPTPENQITFSVNPNSPIQDAVSMTIELNLSPSTD